MKHSIIIGLLIIFGFLFINVGNAQVIAKAKANTDTKHWRYEIQCMGIGNDENYIIKVFSYSKKRSVAMEQAKKNAVHGVIFKGISGGGECTSQPALARDPNIEEEYKSYFNDFFSNGGKFMKYVSETGDGAIAAGDIIKQVGKKEKEYKIGVIVSVNISGLRKELESAKIIKGLSDGF